MQFVFRMIFEVFLASLWVTTNAVTIDCTYNFCSYKRGFSLGNGEFELEEILIPESYTCNAVISEICDTSQELVGVSKTHRNGKVNEDVKILSILPVNSISELPTRLGKFFPNLFVLHATQIGLTKLTSNVLRFPQLRFANFNDNKIKTLDGDLFNYTPNLESFEFANNGMEHVAYGILANMFKLRIVFFSKNCGDFQEYIQDNHPSSKIQEFIDKLKTVCPPADEMDKRMLTTQSVIVDNELNKAMNSECQKKYDIVESNKNISDAFVQSCGNRENKTAGFITETSTSGNGENVSKENKTIPSVKEAREKRSNNSICNHKHNETSLVSEISTEKLNSESGNRGFVNINQINTNGKLSMKSGTFEELQIN